MHTSIRSTKSFRALVTLVLGMFLAAPCFALMGIDFVNPAKAKELGIEVRTTPSGPDALRIEVEFERKGELKTPGRVELEHDGADGKVVTHASLFEEKAKPGRVLVNFIAARASLDKLTVRIVVGEIDGRIGYDLKLKDFVTVPVKAP